MTSLPGKFLRIALKVLAKLELGSVNNASAKSKVVYVTSAIAKEGKTFVAHAVAKSLKSSTVHKILLIDGNMDSPSPLSKGTNEGLSTFFSSNDFDILRAVIKGEGADVDFLPAGNDCKPGLLYQQDKVELLLSRLSESYDIVIIDGAPLLKSGANSLAHKSSGIILVIKAESTSKEVIKEAMLELDIDEERYYGAILNHRPKYIPERLYRKLS